MRKSNETIELSAGDLSNHIACGHLTSLDLALVQGLLTPTPYHDSMLAILRERGQAFEKAYFNHLLKAATKENIVVRCVQKINLPSQQPNASIQESKDNDEVLQVLQSPSVNIAGGTAWRWAREDFANTVDVLFVDEAGQLSLIDVLAVSQAAKDIVMLGDPQQLRQPQLGSHPEGTDVSALEHILQEHKTIPPDKDIFLDETWRMHPEVCSFISESFYEDRLKPRPELSVQLQGGATRYHEAGLWYESVYHEGNQNSTIEEVDRINSIVAELTNGNVYWTGPDNKRRPLTSEDIKVIAPYNAQVALLAQKLPPTVQIGTVGKFQGQESPVIIFSMSTTSPGDAPRGMEFLYSPTRFNVAVSRARTARILVASPRLFSPDWKNPRQMKLANAFCRYRELSKS